MKYLAMLVAITLSANAYAIPCPNVDLLRVSSAALDQAQPYPKYIVYSSNSAFQFESRNWFVGLHVSALTKDDALLKAKAAIANVTDAISPMAIAYEGFYFCAYNAPDKMLVGAMAFDLMSKKHIDHFQIIPS